LWFANISLANLFYFKNTVSPLIFFAPNLEPFPEYIPRFKIPVYGGIQVRIRENISKPVIELIRMEIPLGPRKAKKT
jgi:hypothetical protein